MKILSLSLVLAYLVLNVQVPVAMAYGPTTQAATAVPEQVLFALKQNQKLYELTRDLSYKFEIVAEPTGSTKKQLETGSVVQWGSSGFESAKFTATFGDQSWSSCGYLGPKSLGFWAGNDSAAQQYMYDSPAGKADEAAMLYETCRPPHPELYLSGDGRRFISQIMEDNSTPGLKFRWRCDHIKVGDEDRIRLARALLGRQDKDVDLLTMDLDPRRGFAVRKVEHHGKSGNLLGSFDVDLQDLNGNGEWYPEKIVSKTYLANKLAQSSTTRIFQVLVNPLLQAEDFDVQHMNLPEGTRLIRYSEKGDQTCLVLKKNGFFLWTGPAATAPSK